VTESNLTANLLADSDISHRHFKSEVNTTHAFPEHKSKVQESANPHSPSHESPNQELRRLRQEVADLKRQCQEQELVKETESQTNLKNKEKYKREIKNLKLELSHTESTAQALQRSLHTQLQHNWEQQHELMTSTAKLRAIDQGRIISQETQIKELEEQKLLLEKTQHKLIDSLESAQLELAQNAKALQKMPTGNNRENSKNISLQVVLEQSIRSLQNEYTNSQNRVKDLEDQVGELQEEILKQSGRDVEYEATVQHWKEKSTINQNHVLQLTIALEKLIDGKDIPKLMESNKVDLPAFLVRP